MTSHHFMIILNTHLYMSPPFQKMTLRIHHRRNLIHDILHSLKPLKYEYTIKQQDEQLFQAKFTKLPFISAVENFDIWQK